MSSSGRRVAVTGASGYIGSRLLASLEGDSQVETIVALDRRPLAVVPSGKLHFYLRDINEPLTEIFQAEGVDIVAHLSFVLRPSHNRSVTQRANVSGTENVLRACAESGVKKLLYLSSTTVYGARKDNPGLLTEEHPLRPQRDFQYGWDKAQVETLLGEYGRTYPAAQVAVLRSCVVMGPWAENFITQALAKPLLVGVKGYDPALQFLHEDDLMELMVLALREEPFRGVFNVAGEGAVPYSEMVALSGRRLVKLPSFILYPLLQATWALRLQGDSPAVGLDFIRYPWVADTSKVQRETGYQFRYTSRDALMAYLERKGNTEEDNGRNRQEHLHRGTTR